MNRSHSIAVVVTSLVLMLGGASSWGGAPPNNDVSDANGNTAGGTGALGSNTTGSNNTASGYFALSSNANSDGNIAIGAEAGSNLTSGDNNIYLGNPGAAAESETMRLGNNQTHTFIAGIASTHLIGSLVLINRNGQLGILASSARYKRDIHGMGMRSHGLLQLRPVTFRYKQDPQGQQQYGLIAEEAAKVYPELVVRGAKGEVESIQYHELIPLLLNELQHQQQALGEQARQVAELKTQNERLQAALVQQNATLTARLARLEEAKARAATLARR